MSTTEVKAGQVWKDNDPRMEGRHLRIAGVHDGVVSFDVCTKAGNTFYSGKPKRAKLSRFNGRTNGYSLTRDV